MTQRILVSKPWGSEYLIYENSDVAVWMLSIGCDQSTSFHCHPNKKTGLIILDGHASIELGFLQTIQLTGPQKIMIRPGLFHSTKALSRDGIRLLELETPVDKEDLVRYSDGYGREGKPIEGDEALIDLEPESVIFPDPEVGVINSYSFGLSLVSVEKYETLENFEVKNDKSIFAVIDGGLSSEEGRFVLSAGDIVNASTLKKLIKVFEISEFISFLVIDKNAA